MRWAARVALGVVIAGSAVAGIAAPALAHATLESTNPPSGATVPSSPGDVVLHFDEQVAYQTNSVEVYDANAKRVDTGGTKHPPGDSQSVETAIPRSLPTGGYVVTWRVVSADSHPVHGAFTFFIGTGPAAGSAIGTEAAHLLAKGGGNRTVGVAFGIARFLAFVAVAIFLGGVLFATAIWPEARGNRPARRLLWTGFVVLLLASAASFALQGPYAEGLGLSHALQPSVLSGVWHTRFGHVYAARLVLLAITGLVMTALLRRPRAALTALMGVLGVAILSTWGLADHSATGSWVPLAVPFDVIHIGAAAVWVGGLAMIVVAARSGLSPVDLRRFSQWALGAVTAIAVTGLFAAWRQVGVSWGALTTTPYGKLVIFKAVAFAVLMGLATMSRSAVHGNLAIPFARPRAPARSAGAMAAERPSVLTRAVGGELVIGLVVLALTAWLVQAVPAKQAYAAPFSAEVKAGPDLVDAVIDPAKAGPLIMHVYILTADGAIASVPEVRATMSNAGAGITGLAIPLIRGGPGHFLTQGFAVPIRGAWVVHIMVRTTDIDEFNADPITVHLR